MERRRFLKYISATIALTGAGISAISMVLPRKYKTDPVIPNPNSNFQIGLWPDGNEVKEYMVYKGYERLPLKRTPEDWVVKKSSAHNLKEITFPTCIGVDPAGNNPEITSVVIFSNDKPILIKNLDYKVKLFPNEALCFLPGELKFTIE